MEVEVVEEGVGEGGVVVVRMVEVGAVEVGGVVEVMESRNESRNIKLNCITGIYSSSIELDVYVSQC